MFPRIIYTKNRIFKYYTGFSFFLFIWISKIENDQPRLIRHEKIHFQQQIEMLFIFHWLLYGLFYGISRLKGQRHYIAYRYNPFELEAYGHDQDLTYLRHRRPFAWFRYVAQFRKTLRQNMESEIPSGKEIGW